MKNFEETLNEIGTLKTESKSNVRSAKLHILKNEIEYFETSLAYKKGRIYPGIDEIASFEHDNLFEFFGNEDLAEIGKRIVLLRRLIREAMKV